MFAKTNRARGQRGPVEVYSVGRGLAVTDSSQLVIAAPQLPLNAGYLWRKIRMIFHFAVTHSSDDYPYELGGFYYCTNVNLQADGRQICNVPGAALFWLNCLAQGSVPSHSLIAAATATYDAVVDIPFVFPRFLRRHEDGMLDDTAYTNMVLTVSTGTIAQLFQTTTGAALATTVDVEVIREKTANNQNAKPVFEPEIRSYKQIATSTVQYWDLETNPNLYLLAMFILSGGSNSASFFQNGGSNGAWGGSDAWDAVILDDADRGYSLNNAPAGHFAGERAEAIPFLNLGAASASHLNYPTLIGFQPHIFCKGGSVFSGYPTFAKDGSKLSRLRLQGTLTASKYSDLLTLGARKIGYTKTNARYYY